MLNATTHPSGGYPMHKPFPFSLPRLYTISVVPNLEPTMDRMRGRQMKPSRRHFLGAATLGAAANLAKAVGTHDEVY